MPAMLEASPTPIAATPPRVIDLRGIGEPAASPSVLADPSGRRARRLRVAGRALGTLFLLWLCGLLLAGLGLLPVSDIPFAGSIRAAQEPAKLSQLPAGRPGSAADLRPARPLPSRSQAAGGVARDARQEAASARARSGSAAAVARRNDATRSTSGTRHTQGTAGSTSGTAASPGNSSSTPAATGTTPSSSTTGQTHRNGSATTTSGSGTGHGQSTAPHGSSSTAPGHDPTRTTGHGKSSG
jgi:hypothetical protein